MQRTDSLEKTLMLGKTEGRRRGQQMRWLVGIQIQHEDMRLSKVQKMVKDRKAQCSISFSGQESKDLDSKSLNRRTVLLFIFQS